MKRIYLFAAAAALIAGAAAITSCSQKTSDSEGQEVSVDDKNVKDGADKGIEADVDAGYDPAATLEDNNAGTDAATANDDAAGIATMDDRQAVIVLNNDNVYRPGKKVDRLTILDFNATWCGPCKKFAPTFDEAAAKFGQQVDFVSVDTDVNHNTAVAFGVNSIPCVIFIYPNGKTQTYVGIDELLPASKFLALVQGAL